MTKAEIRNRVAFMVWHRMPDGTVFRQDEDGSEKENWSTWNDELVRSLPGAFDQYFSTADEIIEFLGEQ